LNAYTSVKLKDITRNQARKTVQAIGGKYVKPTTQETVEKLSVLVTESSLLKSLKGRQIRYGNIVPGGLNTAKPGTLVASGWVGSFIQGLYNPLVGDFLDKKFGFDSSMIWEFEPAWDDMVMASPGTIHCIQEKGAKARVVAMPNSALQSALKPLHMAINDILKTIETDCTFNQDAGAEFALSALRSGKSVYSVDLSSATDRFPRHLQLQVLDVIGWTDERKLFQRACEGPWRLDESFDKLSNRFIRYGVGQPMGLYGSFALFALTHNVLLHSLCEELGLNPNESFRVLGDDVVISDDTLHKYYRSALDCMEVPVSQAKTLESDVMAEFAGHVIHRDLGCFKPPKIPSYDGANFLAYLKAFGPKAVKDLPAKVRKVARLVCAIPTELGGLGFNPNGIPLVERLAPLALDRPVTADKESNVSLWLENRKDDIIHINPFLSQLVKAKFELGSDVKSEVVDFLYDQYRSVYDELPRKVDDLRRSIGVETKYISYGDEARLAELHQQYAASVRPRDENHLHSSVAWSAQSEYSQGGVRHRESDLDQWSKRLIIEETPKTQDDEPDFGQR
jgi:hypothetical protein